ncbi:MAG: hypothetical protein MUD14_25115, partial [Hydrococcus sp. Prado102]|nr:hypothetical protein [Hydrococcus sp. Prado102]
IDRDDDETELTLPKELADLLNELNILQQKCDRDDDEIESLRKQLFDDWYQYMHKAYPSEGSRDDYPDLDEVKYFIEKYDLSPLNYRIKNNESLKLQCQNAIEELTNRLRSFNASNTQNNTAYILESIPALRYWLPNESVVLIANPTAKQTSQHRRDERLCKDDDLLECQIFQLNPPQDIAFIEAIDALNPNNNIGFSIWKEQPWHPLLLEWEIEDTSIQDRYEDIDAGYPLARNYGSRTIAENY